MVGYTRIGSSLGLWLYLLATTSVSVLAMYPQWWSDSGVISHDSLVTNDFAAVNQGQVKWIALNAYEHMQANLTEGAGADVSNLVYSFSTTNNYFPVNQGQLKHIATIVYDRLIDAGYATDYPWTNSPTANDYALANIGQVKALFDFNLDNSDTDGDGLRDMWELTYFGGLTETTDGDYDADGMTNLEEYEANTEPDNPDTDADGTADGWEVAHGFSPVDAADGETDAELDGLSNREEYIIGTHPREELGIVSFESFGFVFYQPDDV